jgi:hypothetical protein
MVKGKSQKVSSSNLESNRVKIVFQILKTPNHNKINDVKTVDKEIPDPWF